MNAIIHCNVVAHINTGAKTAQQVFLRHPNASSFDGISLLSKLQI